MKEKVTLPSVIFGTSCLGNLYEALTFNTKLAIVRECVANAPNTFVTFDSAGKYGAGLALEMLGTCLTELDIPKEKVLISNKLGWIRTPLIGDEPTFEKGVWKDLKFDAVQKISYDGILECYYQGNDLLGKYEAQMVSVHDPDEYLIAAENESDRQKRYKDILEAYSALKQLKKEGKVESIGIGSKDWRVIERISKDVDLDWVMVANSLTIHSHPKELFSFIETLNKKGIEVINSAVFNGGFLIGSDYYNYQLVDQESEAGKALYEWREKFYSLCKTYNISPAEACFNYGFNIPGVVAVALNTTKPEKIKQNVAMATRLIPKAFWENMTAEGLL